MFDIATGYLITGFLYLFTPIVTWIVLAADRSRSAMFWCGGGCLLGVGTLLAIFRMSNQGNLWQLTIGYILLLSILIRTHALQVFVGKGFSAGKWLVLSLGFAVCFLIQDGLFDGRHNRDFVGFAHALAYAYMAYIAYRISMDTRSQSGLWIAAVYSFATLVLASFLLDLGMSEVSGNVLYILATTPLNILLVMSGIASAFLSHIGYVGLVLDDTRRREQAALAENVRLEVTCQLNEQMAVLQRQQLMGDFAVYLTHEINQPLTVILSCASLAKKRLESGQFELSELSELVDHILSGSRRANYIIGQTRTFIRPTAEPEGPTDISQVITEVIRIMRLDRRFSKMAFDYVPSPTKILVAGNPIQISQILLNAIRNGLEALAQASRPGVIRITVDEAEDSVSVQVADTGPGFSRDVLDKIGQGFYSTKPDGLGVGLTISRNLALHLGGSLWWGNGPHGGGLVRLKLVRAPAHVQGL
jgi:signal transduction histidine kinase